jgi:hypothetical protein
MAQSESETHLALKQLALVWARENRYVIAAPEVSMPQYGVRFDIAAYRPGRSCVEVADSRTGRLRRVWQHALGMTAVFECKAFKPDYRRDARSLVEIRERLEALHERKARIEHELRLFYPTIRNGDSLFQEYESLDYSRPGHEWYKRTMDEVNKLASQLHSNTKFAKLINWSAANLFYVVAEPGVVRTSEIPAGWGLLERKGDALAMVVKPVLNEIEESVRLAILHAIARVATRPPREHKTQTNEESLELNQVPGSIDPNTAL